MGAVVSKDLPTRERSNAMSCCENCSVRFSVLKRKKCCDECKKLYCAACAQKVPSQTSIRRCQRCNVLVNGTFNRSDLSNYKAKELRNFLTKRHIPVESCKERSDFVELVLQFSNNSQYRAEQLERQRHLQSLQERMRSNISPPASVQNVPPTPPSYSSLYNNANIASQETRQSQQSTSEGYVDHRTTTAGDGTSSVSGMSDYVTVESDNLSAPSQVPNVGPAVDDEWVCVDSEDTVNLGGDCPPPQSTPSETRPVTVSPDGPSHRSNTPPVVEETREEEVMDVDETLHEESATVSVSEQPAQKQEQGPVTPQKSKLTRLADIKSCEEISTLSVRQLKEVLQLNFVDYKGCVEKNELRQKVQRLWKDNEQNETVADTIHEKGELSSGESELCKVCMDRVVDCVLLECGHMLTCTHCGKQLAECPICRQYVVRVVRVFKS